MQYSCQELISLFNDTFAVSDNTLLVRGEDEPVYLPADEHCSQHRIIFAHGFFASAMHEISHWCIAGTKRRLLVDFGYWYKPDGRTATEQQAFEQVEVKPQALEWIFSVACGYRFFFSTDNLSGEASDNTLFKQRVEEQVKTYLAQGMPSSARRWVTALMNRYGRTAALQPAEFDWRQH